MSSVDRYYRSELAFASYAVLTQGTPRSSAVKGRGQGQLWLQ